MNWETERLSKRLTFSAERTEEIFAMISQINATKMAFRLTGKLAPQTISRLNDLNGSVKVGQQGIGFFGR